MDKIEYIDSEGTVIETVEVADADAMMSRARTRAEMLGLTARKYKGPKPKPTEAEKIESARTEAYARINRAYNEALADIDRRYPLAEKLGWHRLDKALDKYQADGTITTGLQRYADELGVTVEDAVTRLEGAIEAYDERYGEATGKLTRLRDAVDAAESVEEPEAIQW